jgi:hypothetical protein
VEWRGLCSYSLTWLHILQKLWSATCDLMANAENVRTSETCRRMTVQYGDDCMRQFMNGQESLWERVRMLLTADALRLYHVSKLRSGSIRNNRWFSTDKTVSGINIHYRKKWQKIGLRRNWERFALMEYENLRTNGPNPLKTWVDMQKNKTWLLCDYSVKTYNKIVFMCFTWFRIIAPTAISLQYNSPLCWALAASSVS